MLDENFQPLNQGPSAANLFDDEISVGGSGNSKLPRIAPWSILTDVGAFVLVPSLSDIRAATGDRDAATARARAARAQDVAAVADDSLRSAEFDVPSIGKIAEIPPFRGAKSSAVAVAAAQPKMGQPVLDAVNRRIDAAEALVGGVRADLTALNKGVSMHMEHAQKESRRIDACATKTDLIRLREDMETFAKKEAGQADWARIAAENTELRTAISEQAKTIAAQASLIAAQQTAAQEQASKVEALSGQLNEIIARARARKANNVAGGTTSASGSA